MRDVYTISEKDNTGWIIETENGGFEVSYISRTEIVSEEDVRAMHCHNNIVEIALVFEGRGISVIGNKEYEIEAGDILVYNKDVLHYDKNMPGEAVKFHLCAIKNLQMKGRPPGKLLSESGSYRIKSGNCYDYLLKGFEMMEELIGRKMKGTQALAKMFVGTLLQIIDIIQINGEKGTSLQDASSNLVDDMRRYIDRNYNENFTLEELAEKFNVNHYYASRIFLKEIGISPIAYRTRRRIGVAQTMLTNTNYSISQIAASVGYNYSSRFTSQFTNIIGISPSEYRRTRVGFNKSVSELQK